MIRIVLPRFKYPLPERYFRGWEEKFLALQSWEHFLRPVKDEELSSGSERTVPNSHPERSGYFKGGPND
jgi:hypothetical protein